MKDGIYRTICGFCHSACGLKVHRSGSKIELVEGDPDHPANRGFVCSKGAAVGEIIQSKDRLTHPLLKSSGGFKQISWDEALDLAAKKLGEIGEKYGPGALVRDIGAPVSYEGRDGFAQFMGAFGSPNFTGTSNICMVPRITAFSMIMGAKTECDFEEAKLIIFWGANPVASNRFGGYCAYNGFHQIISRAKKRGARIISIDPVRSRTVAQSDEWIQIKPGTDTALGLAMIHLIIDEGLYDKEFVAQWTHGFDPLREHVRDCTPKWAESITGIPEAMIVDLARRYATIKPSTICDGNGTDMYTSSVDAPRTMAILIGLTGNMDRPGGNALPPFAVQSTLPTNPAPLDSRFWPEMFKVYKEIPFPVIKESILRNEAHRPRAMIVQHGNPVLVQGNEIRTREALSKLDFLIVNDIFFTATAEIADLVLPSASDSEQYNYRAYSSFEGGFLALGRPIADAPGEARSVFEVEYELARRMEIHQGYPFHDSRSWLEYMLKPTGVTFERFEKEQIVFATPPNQFQKYVKNGFNTPTRKFEFYSETLAKSGYNPLPSYSDPAGEPMVASFRNQRPFSLLGTSRRPGQFVHTKFRHIDVLTQQYPGPLVWIHPQDAAERGIQEGEAVEVMSARGRISLKAKVFEDTMKGLVMVDFGWGNPTDRKGSINVLTNDEFWDPISGGTPNRLFSCEVVKKVGWVPEGLDKHTPEP